VCDHDDLVSNRTTHAVYDTKYHLVWAPKDRQWITREDIRQRAAELWRAIADNFQFEIEEMEVAKDPVHLFLNFPPRYAIAKVVGILKRIAASELFKEFPELRRQLWGGEFWADGYCVRTVGDQVTAEVVKRYIQYHRHDERDGGQLALL
jgi:putative transposase